MPGNDEAIGMVTALAPGAANDNDATARANPVVVTGATMSRPAGESACIHRLPPVKMQEAALNGHRNGFSAALHRKLAEDVAKMGLDGIL